MFSSSRSDSVSEWLMLLSGISTPSAPASLCMVRLAASSRKRYRERVVIDKTLFTVRPGRRAEAKSCCWHNSLLRARFNLPDNYTKQQEIIFRVIRVRGSNVNTKWQILFLDRRPCAIGDPQHVRYGFELSASRLVILIVHADLLSPPTLQPNQSKCRWNY